MLKMLEKPVPLHHFIHQFYTFYNLLSPSRVVLAMPACFRYKIAIVLNALDIGRGI